MHQHINRWANYEVRQRLIAPFDLDAPMGDVDDGTLHEVAADPAGMSPEEALIAADQRDFLDNPKRWEDWFGWSLSERTRQFLQLLANPPEELVEIHIGMRKRADFARERGLPVSPVSKSVSASMVFEVLGCNVSERHAIHAEIKRATEEFSQQ
jgi:hypothetical protein